MSKSISRSHTLSRPTSLVVAAHPDDEILGCGGTIARYSAEEDFFVLVLTNGTSGRYQDSMAPVLLDNTRSANACVGTREVFFENLPNQGLDRIALTTVIQVIEGYIERLRPGRLFTHSRQDLNADHRIVYEASVTAARPVPGQTVRKIYSYFVASSSEWNRPDRPFCADTVVDIKATLDKKIEAMQRYISECRPFPHPRSAEGLRAYAAYWGMGVGLEYGEPFHLIRQVGGL
jgi:LmbE family N-acetylglucosaminyl deacetylase